MYTSEYHNAKETKEILKNGSSDIFFKWYHKKKKGLIHHPRGNTVRTSRLDRIEESIAKLTEEMRNGFKQVDSRIDNLEKDIKDINTRLDYIVKENNLKDSK